MPASEDLNQLDDLFWQVESIIRRSPELIRKVKPKWKSIETAATNTARVFKLATKPGWSSIPQSVFQELTTDVSVPFVMVMNKLADNHYSANQLSLVTWWRRMLATGQQTIITYFSWDRLALKLGDNKTVTSQDILDVCFTNQSMLENAKAALLDDNAVEFRIREMLGGISRNADVREAWKKWAKSNHPDKGGDAETFLNTKIVYEEWLQLHEGDSNA